MTSKTKELLNTSELARRSGLNRATVKTKLETNGVEPREAKAKEKLYDADEALAALLQDGTTGLRKAQTAKTAAEAARAKLKLDSERGELVSIQDVREDVQELVKRIHQHFAVTGPTVLAPQLKGKKVAQLEAALRRDTEEFFNDLRARYKAYLSRRSSRDSRPGVTVSQWAARHRHLSELSSMPGRWHNEVTPYLVEPMDCIGKAGIYEIVFVASSQVGKTEFCCNGVGFLMHQRPSTILYVAETDKKAEVFSKERLAPMIRATPVLRSGQGPAHARRRQHD